MERVAVVSDIHGNRWALAAVLADARARGAGHLVNLGDILYGPLDPAGTCALLRGLDWPSTTIRGNQDRILFEEDASLADSPSLAFTRAALSSDDLAWVRSLPASASLGDLRLVHGTPDSDEVYLLEAVHPDGARPRAIADVAARVAGVREPVLLCGHSHVPRVVQVPGGPLVVNPGSEGLPAYEDALPHRHAMESGAPGARYAMLERSPWGWSVSLHAVAYDRDAAADAATRGGRPEWAVAIRTGWTPRTIDGRA